jgi:hypothetical protein
MYVNDNVELFISESMTGYGTLYHQQYSTNVLSGCTRLGVEVPSSLRQTLIDQHGHSTVRQYSYSTVVAEPQYVLDIQYSVMDASTLARPDTNGLFDCGYATSTENFQGNLVGIGAQFEDRKPFENKCKN